MNTPIKTLYLYLESSGAFGLWTGPDNEEQTPITVQMRELDETETDSDERILLIRNASAGSGDRYVSTPVFLFAVFGKVGESPAYAEEFANLLYDKLLDFDHADSIISIEPLGRISGPYVTGSGRRVFDMEFSVKVDSGRIQLG